MKISRQHTAGWSIIVLIACQLIPLNRFNPSARDREILPADVRKILKKNCYNCHSLETRWPRGAYIAPLSWVIVRKVNKGRKALNFSAGSDDRPIPSGSLKPAVQSMLFPDKISRHPKIPGIPPANLSADELKRLTEWASPR